MKQLDMHNGSVSDAPTCRYCDAPIDSTEAYIRVASDYYCGYHCYRQDRHGR